MARTTVQSTFDTPIRPNELASLAADGNQSPADKETSAGFGTAKFASDAGVEEFWVQNPIQMSRWDKMFPYQLLVLRVAAKENGGTTHTIEPGWQFTLPVPPESLAISTPFAISTAVTMGGIIEEHNGAPIKMLSVRGSTGVLLARGAAQQQQSFSAIETIAGGTVNQLRRTASDLSETRASLFGTAPTNPNLHPESDFDSFEHSASAVAKSSGYYQFRKLQRFLETYVAVKKTSAGRDLRLAFATWKDQSVYVVTPVGFEVNKAAGSPFEYNYSLNFKAWRRVNVDVGTFTATVIEPVRRNPNLLAQLLNTLRDARRTLQSLSKVSAAAIGDANRLIFEPMREVTMFAVDALGVGLSLAELPDSIAKQAKESWVRFQGETSSVAAAARETKDAVARDYKLGQSLSNEIQSMVGAGSTATARAAALKHHPAAGVFKNPKASVQTLETADVASMNLPQRLLAQVAQEQQRVRNFQRRDFERARDQVAQARDQLASAVGAGDPTYDATYSNDVKAFKKAPTQSDWEALFALNNVVMALDSFAATGDNEPTARQNSMEVMSGLARRSGIAFNVPVSKFAVPFPYGATLESLSNTYLGTPDRWHEIATLNGLRAPYVDETGFDLALVVNGSGNQVTVETSPNLFVGQVVQIGSVTVRRTKRTILALREVGPNTVVTVDGPADLSYYKAADAGKLSAFLPDTTNSQQLIYIPSDTAPAEDSFVVKSIPGVREFDPMVAVGGVDLLLTSDNDVVITPDGDSRLAIGLTNIIQNLRVALSVPRGSLKRHSSFGLPITVGQSTAETDAAQVLAAVRRMLSEDPTFARVDGVQVKKKGGVSSIVASVVVQGTEQPIPIGYDVRGDFPTQTS